MEIELKFILPLAQINQFKQAILHSSYQVEDKGMSTLSNAYYDTQEQELRRRDIGLRTRTVEKLGRAPRAEQTVKLAGNDVAGLQQRPEFNLPIPIDDETGATFANLSMFDANIWPSDFEVEKTNSSLVKVFETKFSRHKWNVSLANGALVEVVLDQGCVEAENDGELKQQDICEFELELIEGEVSSLFQLAHYFTSKVNAKLGYLSKAARGYQLAQGTTNKRRELTRVKLKPNVKLEQGFVQSLSYGLNFIQANELVFAQDLTPKSFRRIIDGVSFLIQTLTLFTPYLPGSSCEKYLENFKQWRAQARWTESVYQLEKLQDRKSPYHKDIEASAELLSLLASKQVPRENLQQLAQEFYSQAFNQLLLSFIQWLVTKGWRSEIPLSALSNLIEPLESHASQWLESAWNSVQNAITEVKVNNDKKRVENAYWQLAAGMLTGVVVANLFDHKDREQFRGQLFNLLSGFEEQILLLKLQAMMQQEPELAEHNLKWINAKMDSLQVALTASIASVNKLKPYW